MLLSTRFCDVAKLTSLTPLSLLSTTPQKDVTANIYLFPACYSAAHHMQLTHGICSPVDGHNDARNMLRQC